MNPVMVWRDQTDYRKFMGSVQAILFSGSTENHDEEILGFLSTMNPVKGSPSEVIDKMQAYAFAGADEFIIQWPMLDDFAGLEVIRKR